MADVSQIKLPNGSVYDLIDEKSGYITAEYIENKTDYEIPVSRVGEIVVGETAIGTDSTNFPTSKAVVDYVDERVVQEIDAIDVGITKIKANGTNLPINDGVVNIPVVGPNQSIGLMTSEYISNIFDAIPQNTSNLYNDSGFITSETDPTVPAWAKASTKPTYTANEVGALPSDTVIPQIFMVYYDSSTNTADKTYTEIQQAKSRGDLVLLRDSSYNIYQITSTDLGYLFTTIENLSVTSLAGEYDAKIQQLRIGTNNTWLTYNYQLPRKTSDLTNDSGYLTASDIASVMTYKGTKANYAALPSTGNTTGDVWHLTNTGAEWAWDGSAWQELGTAIDLSDYLTTSDIADWAKASTKPTYTAAEVGALPDTTTIPSKTSDLTNDSGFITGYTETDPIFSASAASGITASDISNWNGKIDNEYIGYLYSSNLYIPKNWTYERDGEIRTYRIPFYVKDNDATVFSSGKVRIIDTTTDLFSFGTIVLDGETKTGNVQLSATKMYIYIRLGSTSYIYTMANLSDIPDTSSFLTSETDPVFSASAAAGITSTDISNWNAKVSDDKTWNGVELDKDWNTSSSLTYVPHFTSTSATSAKLTKASCTPEGWAIAKYDNGYLNSTTPSTSDNSTKVATTAYVNTVIPKVYSSTNTGGYLTMATLPIYDGTVV